MVLTIGGVSLSHEFQTRSSWGKARRNPLRLCYLSLLHPFWHAADAAARSRALKKQPQFRVKPFATCRREGVKAQKSCHDAVSENAHES
jgi:hypothetical protein